MFRLITRPTRTLLNRPVQCIPSLLLRPVSISRSFQSHSQLFQQQQSPEHQPVSKPRLTAEQASEVYHRLRAERSRRGAHTAAYYSASVFVLFLTLAYAAVPLYRVVCQQSGLSGSPVTADPSKFAADRLVPVDYKRRIRVSFSGNTSTTMPWTFTPQQREVRVLPGETALAFYKAKNPTDRDIIGMATYSVVPEKAAPYFSKIQCFCFEEQKLTAGEEVDMPVFFFIDPDFASDPLMRNVDDIILNYTFFQARYDDSGSLVPMTTQEAVAASQSKTEATN